MALAVGIMKINQLVTIIINAIITNFLRQPPETCQKKNAQKKPMCVFTMHWYKSIEIYAFYSSYLSILLYLWLLTAACNLRLLFALRSCSLLSLLLQQFCYEKDNDTLLRHYLFVPLLFLSTG